MQVILLQNYNGCFKARLLIVKPISNHPLHKRLHPPMTVTFILHGIKANCFKFSCENAQCLLNRSWLHCLERF